MQTRLVRALPPVIALASPTTRVAPHASKWLRSSNCRHFSSSASACAQVGTGSAQKIKKFYKKVSVGDSSDVPGAYQILLDGRALKTPKKNRLSVPNELLANIIALEWDSQDTHVEGSSMHLTSLANTVVDEPTHSKHLDRVTALMEYLSTDTVLFFEESPHDLYEMQKSVWNPIIEWFNEKHDIKMSATTGLYPEPLPDDDAKRIREYVENMDPWALAGFEFAVETAKSFIIGDALVCGRLNPQEAADAARVEILFQTQRFGEVEWAHPLEAADTTARLAAASLFARQFLK